MDNDQENLFTINIVEYNKPGLVHELTFKKNISFEQFLIICSKVLSKTYWQRNQCSINIGFIITKNHANQPTNYI